MKFYTPREAAEARGVSVQFIRRYCNEGKIPGAIQKEGNWLIPEDTRKPGTQNVKEPTLTPLAK